MRGYEVWITVSSPGLHAQALWPSAGIITALESGRFDSPQDGLLANAASYSMLFLLQFHSLIHCIQTDENSRHGDTI